MMEDKIREVLGKLVDNSALALKQIFLEMLPEPKKGIKFKEYAGDNGSHFSPTDNQKVGYNQCLTEIKTKLTAPTQQGITENERD